MSLVTDSAHRSFSVPKMEARCSAIVAECSQDALAAGFYAKLWRVELRSAGGGFCLPSSPAKPKLLTTPLRWMRVRPQNAAVMHGRARESSAQTAERRAASAQKARRSILFLFLRTGLSLQQHVYSAAQA